MRKSHLIGLIVFIWGAILIGKAGEIESQLHEPIISSHCEEELREETECLSSYQRIEVIGNITVLWAPECAESITYTYTRPINCYYVTEYDPRTSELADYAKAGAFVVVLGVIIAFNPFFKRVEPYERKKIP